MPPYTIQGYFGYGGILLYKQHIVHCNNIVIEVHSCLPATPRLQRFGTSKQVLWRKSFTFILFVYHFWSMRLNPRCSGVLRASIMTIFGGNLKITIFNFLGNLSKADHLDEQLNSAIHQPDCDLPECSSTQKSIVHYKLEALGGTNESIKQQREAWNIHNSASVTNTALWAKQSKHLLSIRKSITLMLQIWRGTSWDNALLPPAFFWGQTQ